MRSERGFTLLEVMIALGILFGALVIMIRMSASNVRATHRAKEYTIATNLARMEMLDLEEKLLHDGFSAFDQPETGDFADEGYANIKYTATFDKVELPQLQDLQNQAGKDSTGNGSAPLAPALNGQITATPGMNGPDSLMNGMGGAAMGLSMVGQYLPLIQPILENAIRRVNLDVTWKDGGDPMDIKVTCFFTDTKSIDQAMQMFGGAPPSTAATTSSPSGTPATSAPSTVPRGPGGGIR